MLIESVGPLTYECGECRIICIVTGDEWRQNAYIVLHKVSLNTIIIDPGGMADSIIDQIDAIGGRLTHILLTHPHHDHVGAVTQLSARYGLACELHKEDVRLLMQAPTYALTFAKKRIEHIRCFQSFEELCIVNETPAVRALHTPGHTKGSTCYLFEGCVFTGDTLLCKYVGRTDLPGSSSLALHASIVALLAELPDDTVIFPGHGKPWRAREAREWWNEAVGSPPQHDKFVPGG